MLSALQRVSRNFTRKALGDIADLTAVTILRPEADDTILGGSGVIIAPGLVLTAAHVLRDESVVHTVLHRYSEKPAKVVDRIVFEDADIAVVELDSFITGPAIKIAKDMPSLWTGVYSADVRPIVGESVAPPQRRVLQGYTMLRQQDLHQRRTLAAKDISAVSKFRLAATRGNSGAAIFDSDTNELVSMVVFTKAAGAITYGVAPQTLSKCVKTAYQHFAKEWT